MWLKNTDGEKDAVLTMTVGAFILVMAKFLVAGGTLAIGGLAVTAGEIGADDIAAILTPTLGAYVGRRYTDRKFGAEKPTEPVEDPEVAAESDE